MVRDPRGIYSSRKALYGTISKENFAPTCERLKKNAELGLYERPDWLNGKYKVKHTVDKIWEWVNTQNTKQKYAGSFKKLDKILYFCIKTFVQDFVSQTRR